MVALDLGWRKRPDGSIRVAYWADDSGDHGEIVMPASIRAKLKHADDLREIQDIAYNRAQRWFTRWLRAAESAGVALPTYLDEARRYAHQWRSHARIRRLVLETWRGQRFAGDERIFAALERWAHQSRHGRRGTAQGVEGGNGCSEPLNLRPGLVGEHSDVLVEWKRLLRAFESETVGLSGHRRVTPSGNGCSEPLNLRQRGRVRFKPKDRSASSKPRQRGRRVVSRL